MWQAKRTSVREATCTCNRLGDLFLSRGDKWSQRCQPLQIWNLKIFSCVIHELIVQIDPNLPRQKNWYNVPSTLLQNPPVSFGLCVDIFNRLDERCRKYTKEPWHQHTKPKFCGFCKNFSWLQRTINLKCSFYLGDLVTRSGDQKVHFISPLCGLSKLSFTCSLTHPRGSPK